MSLRKLCSQIVGSSNSSFLLRRKYFTINPKVVTSNLSHQLTCQINQSVNYSQALGSLTKDQAHDLVFRMNDEERTLLLRTLEHFNVTKEKDGLTCKKCNALLLLFTY